MKTAEPRSKRVIFNFSREGLQGLQEIPRGKRSHFVEDSFLRALRIQNRIRHVIAFDRMNKGIKVKRDLEGWGTLRKIRLASPPFASKR